MKIPLGEQRVDSKPVATPYSNLDFDTGGGAVTQGLQNLGAGLGQAGQAIDIAAKRAKEKADAVNVTEAQTRYQHEITSVEIGDSGDGTSQGIDLTKPAPPRGFLNTRGKAAFASSAEVLDHLDKTRKEIAQGLANDDQREAFRLRSGGLYEDARRRVEGHVAQQTRVAEVDALAAGQETALAGIASNYADGKSVERLRNSMEGPIRALSTSKEDADAKVVAWDTKVATTLMGQRIASKDWKGAEEQLAAVKHQLGTAAAERFQKTIDDVKFDQTADHAADLLVKGARNEDGRFIAANAYPKIETMADERLRDPVRKRLEQREIIEDHLWADRVKDIGNRAQTLFNVGKFSFESPLGEELNRINPDKYATLKDRADLKYRQHKAGTTGRETKEQREALIRLRADMEENPQDYEAMTAEDFTGAFEAKLSPAGYKEAGRVFASKQRDAKERPGSSAEFNRYVSDEVGSNPLLVRDKKKAGVFRALMGDQWRAWTENNKGNPTPEDLQKMREAVWTTKQTWFGLSSEKVLRERGAVDVPNEERAKIEAALRKKGRPVTDAEIQRIYNVVHGAK